MSNSPTLFSSDDEDGGPELEELLLKKFQVMLQGVPPPPSITMSKLSAIDMLTKYNENNADLGYSNLESKKTHRRENTTPLVYYFNSSNISEEIANLSQKVLSRYVHSETMSTCNIWFEDSTKTNSAKKCLRRSCLGLSPGSRLSHLARRRQVFSSENLQKLANSEKRCQIEIMNPNVTKSKGYVKSGPVEVEKSNSFKRALFLSPEDGQEDSQQKLVISSQKNLVSNSSNSILEKSTKSLWFSQRDPETSSSKKRKMMDSKERTGNWPRRALTFTEKDLCKNQDPNSSNMKVISEIQLNLHHKTKILWAVSVTLKEKNINSKDPLFKSSASALFMICRKNLSKILNMKIQGGTSDKILHFAREHVDDILKKLDLPKENRPKETDDSNKNFNDTTISNCNQNSSSSSSSSTSISNNNNSNSNVLKNNENECTLNEQSETIETRHSNNETQVSADNESTMLFSSESDKGPLLTLSTVVDVNVTSPQKENINVGDSNYNLVSQI